MEYSTEKEFLQPILDHGMERMSEVLQNLFNLAMKLERENALKASPYQRTEGRTGYANGFKISLILDGMSPVEYRTHSS